MLQHPDIVFAATTLVPARILGLICLAGLDEISLQQRKTLVQSELSYKLALQTPHIKEVEPLLL
jgi:hypothetical protein